MQELELIKNETIQNIIEVFGRDTLGRNSDMILNELLQKEITSVISEKEVKKLTEKIALLKLQDKDANTKKITESYLLPRIMSKVVPTNLVATDRQIEKDYADFTQVGFTEFCSNYVAKEKKIMYQIPENHKPNLEFVEDMVHEMKKFPKEFSSQIFKSIFHYNINQLEMQFSSFAPSTHFFEKFESQFVYTTKLERIKKILMDDFEEEELSSLIQNIKSHKKVDYAILYLQKKLLEKYKNNLEIYNKKIQEVEKALKENSTSSSQSKENASTRVLAKTGSIKGLAIFVFSVLFALVLAYFLAK